MEKKSILATYIPIVDFIADIIGRECEVVLHDTADPTNSIIAIRNGYISGRKLGGPLTDLGLKLITAEHSLSGSAITNYASRTMRGEDLISSTYYIRDEQEQLVGMLCVNILRVQPVDVRAVANMLLPDQEADKTDADDAESAALHASLNGAGSLLDHAVQEVFSTSVDHVVVNAVEQLLDRQEVPVERMSPEEKRELIRQLSDNGIFRIKGAVGRVAKMLQLSSSSIYRYLSQAD